MKIEAMKYLLKTESLEILMLQETKIEGEALLDLCQMKWKRNDGKAVSVRGTSGGISTVCIKDQF